MSKEQELGMKEGLKLAIDIIRLYDVEQFTKKSFRKEIISHLYREVKSR